MCCTELNNSAADVIEFVSLRCSEDDEMDHSRGGTDGESTLKREKV